MLDIKSLLDAADIDNVIIEHTRRPESATFVRIAVLSMRDNLDSGTIPSGMRMIDIAVEPYSHEDDDGDGSRLAALVENCREVIYDDGIVASLNTASTYNTYYGLAAGDDLPDVDERYRLRSIQFSLILKPEKAE